MNEALRELIGKKVRIETDGIGVFLGTLEASDTPWIRVRTDKGKVRCVPVHRVYYIEAAE